MKAIQFPQALFCCVAFFSVTVSPPPLITQQSAIQTISIDARSASQVPQASGYIGGSSISPDGHTLGLNSMYLTHDGKPWLPVMGEFHFSRVPQSEWEPELLKMKAAGVQIVATYLFWIHHEEIEGRFDWSGQRDLRAFLRLCAKHHLYVIVRVGPWAHGEARNGGLPDWLLKKGPTRRNDHDFMRYVGLYFAQIARQLHGLLWKDGGPVIGIQLENEYSSRGPEQGEEYILTLKKLVVDDGLDVPFYTVTGWDNAVIPTGKVLSVYGGYPDAPWDATRTALPPNEVYLFRFGSRVSGSMGMQGVTSHDVPQKHIGLDTPFITAEIGGGVQDTYHRRPIIAPDDVAAMMPVMLGSGVNLYGTYMFQGGENPDGNLTTLQESQSTGYPTDVPVKSYDFQAPLGEFGQERASFRKLKIFNYFLNDFGSLLAPMSVHAPAARPTSPSDFSPQRAAVRSAGRRGFLFVNNYVRGSTMPARKSVQFAIQLPGSVLRIPEKPIDIPSGAYFIWPFNFDLGITSLRFTTTQLFTRIHSTHGDIYFFEQVPGIPSQFILDDEPDLSVTAAGAAVRRRNGTVAIDRISTGFEHPIVLRRRTSPETRIIVLTQSEAEHAWKVQTPESQFLVETPQDFYASGNRFVLLSQEIPQCTFSVYPDAPAQFTAEGLTLTQARSRDVMQYSALVPGAQFTLNFQQTQDASPAPPVQLGPPLSWRPQGVAMAPDDSAFKHAAKWQLTVHGNFDQPYLSNLFLLVHYKGDVARLTSGEKLLDDNFYNGTKWTIGLLRFEDALHHGPLTLSILPLRQDAPIFLEKQAWPDFGTSNQAIDLKSITVAPEYRFTIAFNSSGQHK